MSRRCWTRFRGCGSLGTAWRSMASGTISSSYCRKCKIASRRTHHQQDASTMMGMSTAAAAETTMALLLPPMDWYVDKSWRPSPSPSPQPQSTRSPSSATTMDTSSSMTEVRPVAWSASSDVVITANAHGNDNSTQAMRTDGSPNEPVNYNQLEAVVARLVANSTDKILGHLSHDRQAVLGEVTKSREIGMNLADQEGNCRDCPTLWTLERHDGRGIKALTSTYETKLRSQLTGKCFHEDRPILIPVANEFFATHGVFIKTGLSILSSVVPDFLGKGVVDLVTSEAQSQIDRSVDVHNLVEGLDLKAASGLAMEQKPHAVAGRDGGAAARPADRGRPQFRADAHVQAVRARVRHCASNRRRWRIATRSSRARTTCGCGTTTTVQVLTWRHRRKQPRRPRPWRCDPLCRVCGRPRWPTP